MRGSSVLVAFAFTAWIPFAAVANAQQATPAGSGQGSALAVPSVQNGSAVQAPAPQGSQAPMGGRAFGEHVSGMTPDHPKTHGRHFGECVSEMAIAGACSHHDEL